MIDDPTEPAQDGTRDQDVVSHDLEVLVSDEIERLIQARPHLARRAAYGQVIALLRCLR